MDFLHLLLILNFILDDLLIFLHLFINLALTPDNFKTKELNNNLKKFSYTSALFIHSETGIDKNFKLASSNIPKVSILNQKGINVKDLITFDTVFIEQKSLDEITKRLI